MSAQWYDANISLPGCDKNMPGTIMAMARLNRPSLMIYGGAGLGAGQGAVATPGGRASTRAPGPFWARLLGACRS